MKRILILADINSSHSKKWVNAISDEFEVGIFSLSRPDSLEGINSNIRLLNDNFVSGDKFNADTRVKISYLKEYSALKRIIKSFKPDIVHSHYATSYGLFGALSGKHPFIVSVWGSDVFEFPRKSFAHRQLVKWIFRKADKILSTSLVMQQEIKKYSNKEVIGTPFGVDTNMFQRNRSEHESITIGIVKSLEHIYGIDILIKAFGKVKQKYANKKLLLSITGDGTEVNHYKILVDELGLKNSVIFNGKITHSDVPKILNSLDLFVCPSRHESFGVSVLEASACELPVIVTNVGGLPEVIQDQKTGLIIKSEDVDALAESIGFYIDNPVIAETYGKQGRAFVISKFNWDESVKQINDIYRRL